MKRSLNDVEYEIKNQISICELCLDVCSEVPRVNGASAVGADFLPYFYNLNFSKAIISLHSLLLSKQSNEISIKNYLNQYKNTYPQKDITVFEEEIKKIQNTFENISPVSLRNKVLAHFDVNFKHSDFLGGYIMPNLLTNYSSVLDELKTVFFRFANYALEEHTSYEKIIEQSKLICNYINREI